jgi:hypothetical protein
MADLFLHTCSSASYQSSEHSLAIILAAIVFVFMICDACRFFLAFYQVP